MNSESGILILLQNRIDTNQGINNLSNTSKFTYVAFENVAVE